MKKALIRKPPQSGTEKGFWNHDPEASMRIEPFTMERDVLKVGDVVEITEGRLPRAYYYTAEPAAAMSRNFTADRRIKSTTGTVREITLKGSTYTVMIEFDE